MRKIVFVCVSSCLVLAGVTAPALASGGRLHSVNLHSRYLAYLARERPETVAVAVARPSHHLDHAPTRAATCGEPSCPVVYNGGPVQHNPAVYLLLWGPKWSSSGGDFNYLDNFLAGLGIPGSDTWSTTTEQYGDSTGGSSFTGSVLQGAWQDSSAPPYGATQDELSAEADGFYSYLGLSDATDTQIIVATQSGTCPKGFYAPGKCSGGQYCAWHSDTSGNDVPFTNLPYQNDGGINGCGGSVNSVVGGSYGGFSVAEGHEFAETVTDPFPYSGWIDLADSSGGEIGDKCVIRPGTNSLWLANLRLSTGTFAMQPLWSNAIDACSFITSVPGAPAHVQVVPGEGDATVSWSAPSPNGSPITSYTVSANPGGQTATVTGSPPVATTVVSGLTDGTAYTFTVTATNAMGAGSPSAASTPVAPGTPTQPTGVAAAAGDGQALVSWNAPQSDNGSAVTGYTVTAEPGGRTTTVAGSSPITVATVSGLVNGTKYTFTVAASNAIGAGPASLPSKPTAPQGPPTVTLGLSLATGGSGTWAAWRSAAKTVLVARVVAGRLFGSESLGGCTAAMPTLAVTAAGPAVAVEGCSNGDIYLDRATATGWSGWSRLVGTTNAAPALAVDAAGTLWLACRGSNEAGYLAHQSAPGQPWSRWTSLGGILSTGPGLTTTSGEVLVAGAGTNHTLYLDTVTSGVGHGWMSLGAASFSAPALATDTAGNTWVLVRSSADALFVRTLASAWVTLVGSTSAAPALAPNDDGLIAAVEGGNGHPYTDIETSGRWAGWVAD